MSSLQGQTEENKMTKKDFKAIADVIKYHIDSNSDDPQFSIDRNCKLTLESLAQDLAVVFASDNPRFDQDRFLEACGL